MQGGLVTSRDTIDASEFYAMGHGQPAMQATAAAAPTSTSTAAGGNGQLDVEVAATPQSHLDSWFDTHAVTRDDVILFIGVMQMLLTAYAAYRRLS